MTMAETNSLLSSQFFPDRSPDSPFPKFKQFPEISQPRRKAGEALVGSDANSPFIICLTSTRTI